MQNPKHPDKRAYDHNLWDLALVLTLLHASYVTLGKSQFLHLQKGRSGGDGFGGYKHSIRDRGWANSTLPHKSRRRKKHLLTVVNVTQL